jgi:hypothetical protein
VFCQNAKIQFFCYEQKNMRYSKKKLYLCKNIIYEGILQMYIGIFGGAFCSIRRRRVLFSAQLRTLPQGKNVRFSTP